MFRRAIIRQSCTLTSSTLSRSFSTKSTSLRLEFSRPSVKPSTFRPVPPRLFRRWQSTETEKNLEASPVPPEELKTDEAKEEDPLKKELEAKSREIIDLKVCPASFVLALGSLNATSCHFRGLLHPHAFISQDKYLRSVAEFRNLQDRTKRDIDSARQFAIQRFAIDLADSIDNLDRALEIVPQEAITPVEDDAESDTTGHNKDLVNLYTGLKLTESILMSTLKKHGLERFDPVDEGRKFDPRLDEATFMTKVEGKEDGEVFHTQSKGYTLNGRVLRAAKVGVVKNS